MEVLCEMQDSQECVVSSANADLMLIKWFTHYCSWATAMWCIYRLLYSLQVQSPEAADRVRRCVSCWKLRLPCPCDPYGHCQRPCQGSAPYQLACSPLWLSLPARGGVERRKEKGGERCLFVCLPALFYLGVFADHSSDWPRNVTVLCRAEWTPDSAMEASDFL